MNKKLIATVLSTTVLCSALVNASATDVIEQNGIVYAPDHSVFFVDVNDGYSWALQSIDYLANAGIIKGKEHCVYNADADLTRADFITMLSRAYNMTNYANDNNFADVEKDKYYTSAVSAAKNLGIVSGDENGNFNPEAPLTRQDAIVILKNTLEKTGITFNKQAIKSYEDTADIASYAADAVWALTHSKVVCGNDGKLLPKDTISRAEVAVLLYRSLMLDKNGLGEPIYIENPDVINLCVGDEFYPNVKITNYTDGQTFAGLYNCSKLYGQGEEFYAEINESAKMDDNISWNNGILSVNGEVVDVAEDMTSICIDPYSLLSNEPISTGNEYKNATASVQDGVVTTIYYSK